MWTILFILGCIVVAAYICLVFSELIKYLTYREPRTYLAQNYKPLSETTIGGVQVKHYTGTPPPPEVIINSKPAYRLPQKGALRRRRISAVLEKLIEQQAEETIERRKRMEQFLVPTECLPRRKRWEENLKRGEDNLKAVSKKTKKRVGAKPKGKRGKGS